MKKKRSILCCLLCMLLSLFGAFSSFAYSVASKSDADFFMQNAQEFVPNYVPMKEDPASPSDSKLLKLYSPALRSSAGSVSNTITLNRVKMYCRDSSDNIIGGSDKYLTSQGNYTFISSSRNISNVTINIPKSAMPQTGKYYMSYSYSSDVAYEYSSIYLLAHKTSTNAAPGTQQIYNLSPDVKDNAGGFRRSEVLIDLANVTVIEIIGQLKNPSDAVGGQFHMRFKITNESGGEELGYSLDQSESSQITANNTSELVYSQNETNGLLHDIIQHISDQLAAMWDQIYNLMAVPWIQNDNQRTNNTISAIEENSENTQTTIEQQTQWHGNFIIDGLKGLFIPSDDYFSNVTTDLFDWFEDKFGFLGYTLTYFIRLLNGIMGASQNTVIHFPGIKVPNRATSEVYNILPEQDVDLGAQIGLISEGSFSLLEFMRTAGDIVLVLGFVVMLQNKLHEVETQ